MDGSAELYSLLWMTVQSMLLVLVTVQGLLLALPAVDKSAELCIIFAVDDIAE